MAQPYRNVGSIESTGALVSATDQTGAAMDYDSVNGYAQITAKASGVGASLGLRFRAVVAGVLTTLLSFAPGSTTAAFAGAVTATASSATVATFNRTTSNGQVVAVQLLGQTVGELRANAGGQFVIGSVAGGLSADSVVIANNSGTAVATFASAGVSTSLTLTGTAGTAKGVTHNISISQSGTAAYTAWALDVSVATQGSGVHRFMSVTTGGSTDCMYLDAGANLFLPIGGLTAGTGVTVSAGGITVQAGASTFQAVTMNGTLTLAPSSGASPLIASSVNAYAAIFNSTVTANQSFGLAVSAGTSASDTALLVRNAAASTNYLIIRGDGVIIATLPTAAAGLPAGALWNSSGTVHIV
jgi:hypothetical protein